MTGTNNFAKAEMLIRKPIDEVFEAFINPEITTKFWFTKSSGKLEEGADLNWSWEMYNVRVLVNVKKIEVNKNILIEWGTGEQQSKVKWTFRSLGPAKTFLTISNFDFKCKEEDLMSQIRDSTGGFTIVVAGLKAWLEHNIELRLIEDKFPKELMNK